jgi:hypothetical protein
MHELLCELFPWIVALYLVDGLADLRRGHVLFIVGPRRARLLRSGLHLAGLSPFDERIDAHDLPFLAGSRHVFFFDPRRRSDPALVAASDLEAVERSALAPVTREGSKICARGRTVLLAPGSRWAERLRDELAALAALAAGAALPDRPAPDALAAARALRARERPFILAGRAVAALAAVTTFVLAPLSAYGPVSFLLPAGAVLSALAALVLAGAAIAGALSRVSGETLGASLVSALHLVAWPIGGLRPLAHASRALLRGFDAATVAAAVLAPADFGRFAAREIRRARLSRDVTDPELAPAWDARVARLSALLASAGVAEADVSAPPQRSVGAGAWCPICEAQYRPGYATCSDCMVATLPFA